MHEPDWDHINFCAWNPVGINDQGETCAYTCRYAWKQAQEGYTTPDLRTPVTQGPYPMMHHVLKRGRIPR